MLGQEVYVDIHVMHLQGMSVKAISRELPVSRNTVRRYLRSTTAPEPQARSAKAIKLAACLIAPSLSDARQRWCGLG